SWCGAFAETIRLYSSPYSSALGNEKLMVGMVVVVVPSAFVVVTGAFGSIVTSWPLVESFSCPNCEPYCRPSTVPLMVKVSFPPPQAASDRARPSAMAARIEMNFIEIFSRKGQVPEVVGGMQVIATLRMPFSSVLMVPEPLATLQL